MTDREKVLNGAKNRGFEVTEIGCTLQWTMASGKTCIQYFAENGSWVKTEWI